MVEAEGLRPLAARTGIPLGQIRSLIDGRAVRITTLESMTSVLGVRLTIGPGPGGELSLAPPYHRAPRSCVHSPASPPAPGTAPLDSDRSPVAAQLHEGVERVKDLADRVAGAAHSLLHLVSGWDPLEGVAGSRVLIPFAPSVTVTAGDAEPAFEASDVIVGVAPEALPVWTRADRMVCLRTAGDAMEATCRGGDLVAVDRGETSPLDGQLFALATDAGVTVRRLRFRDRWILAADNPAYPDRPLTDADRILGRVAWHGPHDPQAPGQSSSVGR